MSATSTKNREFRFAFGVDKIGVEKLWELASTAGMPTKVTFHCSDGSQITSDEISTLLEFPNAKDRQITYFKIYNENPVVTRIAIEYWGDYAGDPMVKYSVTGKDRDVSFISTELDERIKLSRRWYSQIVTIPGGVLGALFVLAVVMAGFLTSLGMQQLREPSPAFSRLSLFGIDQGYVLLLAGAAFFLAIWRGYALLRWTFPPAEFLVGDGVRRAERAAYTRKTIGGGLGLSVLVKLTADFFLKLN